MKLLLPFISVFAAASMLGQSALSEGDLRAELIPTRSSSSPGSPVLLKVVLSNASRHLVVLPGTRIPGGVDYDLVFDVRGQGSKPVPKRTQATSPSNPADLPLNPGFSYPLQPGESVTINYDIGKSYNLSRRGTYTIRLTHIAGVASPSNTVRMRIAD